ncbi:MAG TPA: hypothetical protein VJ891_17195 [Casimicrobiaceae bacterium]|nr:hypothetical protein [Casimicrobiaceae bacterium]
MEALLNAHPSRFAAVRREILRNLCGRKRSDDVAVIRRLKRPTAGIWVCNQLARTRSEAIANLLDLGARWIGAYARANNRSAIDELAELRKIIRQTLVELTAAARAELEGAGLRPTRRALHDAYFALQAYSTWPDENARTALRRGLIHGRLHTDHVVPTQFLPQKLIEKQSPTEPANNAAGENKIRKWTEAPNRN